MRKMQRQSTRADARKAILHRDSRSRPPLHTQALRQRNTGRSNSNDGPGQKCGSAARMICYLCVFEELCEYFDTRKGIQAHLMSAVMCTQDLHGPCDDKRGITPEPRRIRCEPESKGCTVRSPEFMYEEACNRSHRELWRGQVLRY